jgi:hypothetical protein
LVVALLLAAAALVALAAKLHWFRSGAVQAGPPVCAVVRTRVVPAGTMPIGIFEDGRVVSANQVHRTQMREAVFERELPDGGAAPFPLTPLVAVNLHATTTGSSMGSVLVVANGDPSPGTILPGMVLAWSERGGPLVSKRTQVLPSFLDAMRSPDGILIVLAGQRFGVAEYVVVTLAWGKKESEIEAVVTTTERIEGISAAMGETRSGVAVRTRSGIRFVRFDKRGRRIGEDVPVTTLDVAPTLSWQGDTAVVVWTQPEGSTLRLYGASLAPDAAAFSAPVRLSEEAVFDVAQAAGASGLAPLLVWPAAVTGRSTLHLAPLGSGPSLVGAPLEIASGAEVHDVHAQRSPHGAFVSWLDDTPAAMHVAEVTCSLP